MRRLLCRVLGGHTIDPDPGDFVLRCTRCGHLEDLPPAPVMTHLGWYSTGGRLIYTGTEKPHGDNPQDWPLGTVWLEGDR